MYTPRLFKEERPEVLVELIRENSFGVLYTSNGVQHHATHLPFMIDTSRGPQGTLIAHFARANPHWKSLSEGDSVLSVFSGPHSYISPAWYVEKETVPTWNYAAVHVTGTCKLVHEIDPLRTMVMNLVKLHETSGPEQWDYSLAEGEIEKLLPAIVGIEISVVRMDGKFKFNQNRSREDQEGVVEALSKAKNSTQRAVAELMKAQLMRSEAK